MTFNEAYERYLVESESNGVTDKLSTNKQRFKISYNKSIIRLSEYMIERKSDDENRYIQLLKVIDKKLYISRSKDNKDFSQLPENYLDFIDLNAFGFSEKCFDQPFKLKEIKPENVNKYLSDEFTKPSFKYRESFYTIANNEIVLYKDKDFDFKKVLLSYYRYPQLIELVDKENPESDFIQADIEFDDKFTNRVITLAVSLHSLNTDDPKFQVLLQQAATKI